MSRHDTDDPLREAMRQTIDDWADIQEAREKEARAAAAAALEKEQARRSESLRRALVIAPVGKAWRG